METLKDAAQSMGEWIYTLYSVKIPLINVSLWLFVLSIFALKMFFRTSDAVTHRSQGGGGQDQNNNVVYREERK